MPKYLLETSIIALSIYLFIKYYKNKLSNHIEDNNNPNINYTTEIKSIDYMISNYKIFKIYKYIANTSNFNDLHSCYKNDLHGQ